MASLHDKISALIFHSPTVFGDVQIFKDAISSRLNIWTCLRVQILSCENLLWPAMTAAKTWNQWEREMRGKYQGEES